MRGTLLATAIFLCILTYGQNTGCNYPQSNQFDYWVGDWNVYDTLGNLVGENSVVKQYENCAIQEKWISTGVNKGTSYNYFNPTDTTWNQLWLDNQGSILILKGSFSENKMVMRSDLIKRQKGQKYYNQITWVNNSDGTVSQIWEVFGEQNQFLQLAFHGVYKKKN